MFEAGHYKREKDFQVVSCYDIIAPRQKLPEVAGGKKMFALNDVVGGKRERPLIRAIK